MIAAAGLLLGRVPAWARLAIGVLLVVVGVWCLGRESAIRAARTAALERELADARTAADELERARMLPAGAAAAELRREWMR